MNRTLTVSLQSGTLYVSGKVNGTQTVWTNIKENLWQTTAARSEKDVYQVELTVVSASGTTSTCKLTLYYGVLSLITDRTDADLLEANALRQKIVQNGWDSLTAAEQAKWQTDLKGAYNASDLNRVGAAVEYVSNRLDLYGWKMQTAPKTDWTQSDIPSKEQLSRYIADIQEIRGAGAVYASTPEAPKDAEKLTYTQANDIEQILLDTNALIDNMIEDFHFAGEIYSGEV